MKGEWVGAAGLLNHLEVTSGGREGSCSRSKCTAGAEGWVAAIVLRAEICGNRPYKSPLPPNCKPSKDSIVPKQLYQTYSASVIVD